MAVTRKGTIKKWKNDISAWDLLYPKTTIDQVIDLSSMISDINNELDERLGINEKAADSNKLDGHDSSYFAILNHDHDDDYVKKNPDGDGNVIAYNDSNPTIDGQSVGGGHFFGADGSTTNGFLSAKVLFGRGIVHSINGYYVGSMVETSGGNGIKIADGAGKLYYQGNNIDYRYLGITAKAADSDKLDGHDINDLSRQSTYNGWHNTLSAAYGAEKGYFDAMWVNKFAFYPTDKILIETSTDGESFTTSTEYSDSDLKKLTGGDSNANVHIPNLGSNGSGYKRFTFTARGYVYISELYLYTTKVTGTLNVKVEAYHNTNGWTTIKDWSSISGWPSHHVLRHTNIAFNPTNSSQYGKVRLTFYGETTNSSYINHTLYKIEWWGGYPAGNRHNYMSVDQDKNVKIYGNINGDVITSDEYIVATDYIKGITLRTTTANTRDKIRLWDADNNYIIGMKSGYSFGSLNNDYAMSFQMNDDNDRGFWWGDSSHDNAHGAMALSTNGKLTVAHSLRLGYGESDTIIPGVTYKLDINGNSILKGDVILNDNSSSSPELKFQNQSFIAGIDLYNNTQRLRFIDRTNGVSRIEFNLANGNIYGAGGQLVVLTNDNRLSDDRNPKTSWFETSNRILKIGNTSTGNEAGVEINTSVAGSPQIGFTEHGDMSWAIGGDDDDNSFKIHGVSGATIPTINGLTSPMFELTTGGDLIISSKIFEGSERVYSPNNKPTPSAIGAASTTHTHSNYLASNVNDIATGIITFSNTLIMDSTAVTGTVGSESIRFSGRLNDTLFTKDLLIDSAGTLKFAGTAISLNGHTHTKSQISDFPTSMPASDVYSWAKASSKPAYTASEVGARADDWVPSQASVYRGTKSDADTALDGGYYNFANGTNYPAGVNYGILTVVVQNNVTYNGTNNWIWQYVHGTGGEYYYRYKINANNWTSWYKIYSSQYKPTASEVGARADNWVPSWSQVTSKPTSMPASDVYSWAKASSKPAYTASEVGALPIVGGSMNGNITLGTHALSLNGADLKNTGLGLVYDDDKILTEGNYASFASRKFINVTSLTANTLLHESTHADKLIRVAGSYTLSIGTGWSIGAQITIMSDTTGTVTIDPQSNVYINGSTSNVTITSRYNSITLVLYQDDGTHERWVAMGV